MAGNQSDLGFGGARPTTSIVNAFSSGGASLPNISASGASNLARELLSGPLTAGVLKKVLSVTGGGVMPLLSVYTKDATARTVRIQVIVDGQVTPAFDAISDSIAVPSRGIPVIGTGDGSYYGPSEPIRANSTIDVWIASSLTETDKLAIAYKVN